MPKREWSPDDPVLESPHGPHEIAAVLRLHRSGWPAPVIAKTFHMRASKLLTAIQRGMSEAHEAEQANRPLHQEIVTKGIE